MIIQDAFKIISNLEIAPNYYKLTFSAPEITKIAKPSQFINIRVNNTCDPLLRRPFSIYDINNDELTIIYKVVGKGTQILSEKKPGELLDVIGPLGSSFKLPASNSKIAVIAGGIGLAAVHAVIKNSENEFDLFYGVKSKNELIEVDYWESLAEKTFLSSDDGSCGEKTFITDLFNKHANNYNLLLCCGPKIMMRKISQNNPNIESYFMLEEYMACGLGLCMGCVCETKSGNVRICKEGPALKGENIKW
jgi:dihydroorotate dehydrogenase electron transfer subunit